MENYFDNTYINFYNDYLNESITNEEVDFIKSFIDKSDKVLDLCCGHGRHTINLKKSGVDVVGIDNSIQAIEYAKAEATKNNLGEDMFKTVDILKDSIHEKYDVIILLGNSLGLFLNEDCNVLEKVRKALKPEGYFILDLTNRDYILKNWQPNYWLEKNNNFCLHKNSIDFKNNVLELKEFRIVNNSIQKYECKTNLYSFYDINSKISKSGFNLVESYGGYNKEELSVNSTSLLMVLNIKKDDSDEFKKK
ncbi:class I SAM-dependent methyltransferase [Clostridium akagii]|uniref:class I SAM-dependent methyltransferase n=1 Tax=Clostridium akagii TaxID=91623 RepID=UPI000479CC97|nr:class I SAM-dependent methyltransferase [Clostridium akagii]